MQSRSASFSQLLQAWKAQPVYVSVVSCNGLGDAASAMARSMMPVSRQGASTLPHATASKLYSNKSNSTGNASRAGGEHPSPGDSSFWASLRRSLLPVGPSKSAAPSSPSSSASPSFPSSSSSSSSSVSAPPLSAAAASWQRRGPGQAAATASRHTASPAAAAASVAGRDARAPERRAARATEDAFKPLSKGAERFSGTLLKAAVLLITIPLAVHMLSHSLMMSLCVRGLEAERPETVALTLRRVRSVVVSDFLASRFEENEGVGLVLATFSPGATEAVLREFISTAEQLLQFPSTRDALLMSSLVERLERALGTGWIPEELREAARQLYLDAHASLRMEVEAGVETTAGAGAGAGAGSGAGASKA